MTEQPAPAVRRQRQKQPRFTVVFEGDLAEIAGNPFHILSRFGKPVAISAGDALDTLDRQEMTRSQLTQKLIDDRLATLRRA